MNPILYEEGTTDFNDNGLGSLSESLSSYVTEVANGEFELEVVYPTTGYLYKELKEFRLLSVKPNKKDSPHAFEIYDYELDSAAKTVTLYARTITNKLAGNLVKKVVVKNNTPQEAMALMKNNLVVPTDFTFFSDISTRSSTEWINRNPLNCIAGEEGSLLHYWGGEIKRDNRTIYLYKRRGMDNAVVLREERDLNGMTVRYSTEGMVTRVVPYRTYTPEGDDKEEITEYGSIVDSQYVNNYPNVFIRAIDYSSDDDVDSLATMNTKAKKFFSENSGIDKPSMTASVDLIELSESPEYKDFKDFETIGLFDTVTVYSKRFDVNLTSKVNKVVYDTIREKNISVELGSYKTGLIESVEKEYQQLNQSKEDKLINVIQIAANGKNRIFRGDTEPTKGMAKNDLWYQPVGAGETMLYRFDGAHWQLEKVSAGLLGGTLDAENGDVNLINVNVNNLVGNRSEFIQTYWNGINNNIKATSNEIVATDTTSGQVARMTSSGEFISKAGGSDLSQAYLRNGRLYFRNTDGTATLNVGAHPIQREGTQQGSVATARSTRLYIGRFSDYLDTNSKAPVVPYISLQYAGALGDESRGYVKLHKFLSMSGQVIEDVQQLSGYELNVRSTFGKLMLGIVNDGKNYNTIEVGYANALFNGNINFAPGYGVTTTSDERLKNIIGKTKHKGLEEVNKLEVVDFTWNGKDFDEEMGLVAQKSPFLATQTEDGTYALLDAKHRMLNTLAIQELDQNATQDREELKVVKQELAETKQELADLKTLLIEKGVI